MLEATISPSSPRYQDWLADFGTDKVRITGWANAKVLGLQREIYRLDIESLNEEQRERLAQHLARKFGHPIEEVRESIVQDGVPILAEDVYMVMDLRVVL